MQRFGESGDCNESRGDVITDVQHNQYVHKQGIILTFMILLPSYGLSSFPQHLTYHDP